MTILPNPFTSVSAMSAEGVVPAGETPAPIAPALVGTPNSISASAETCGGMESRHAECAATCSGQTDTPCTAEPEVAPGPQDFIPAFQPDFEKLFNTIMGKS